MFGSFSFLPLFVSSISDLVTPHCGPTPIMRARCSMGWPSTLPIHPGNPSDFFSEWPKWKFGPYQLPSFFATNVWWQGFLFFLSNCQWWKLNNMKPESAVSKLLKTGRGYAKDAGPFHLNYPGNLELSWFSFVCCAVSQGWETLPRPQRLTRIIEIPTIGSRW